MKKALQAAWRGIMIAAVIFVISSGIIGAMEPNEVFSKGSGMLKNCIATFAIGIGFGLPSLIYETEFPFVTKVLIHMGIGCTVLVAASFFAGWNRTEGGFLVTALVTLGQIAIAFVVWFISYQRAKKIAKSMNSRIELKQ